jgi:ectoine hydroxylase-related dioxygenase (phytanoyl-CoA dioxygenase family)
MFIDDAMVAQYQRDGYVLLENVFTEREVAAMLHEVEQGQRVAEKAYGRSDSSGKRARLALWHELGDDIWAMASTNPRVVNVVRVLMGEEIAFFHGKVMLKEAKTGGSWEWHQDYGYWYNQGFAFPRMMSAFVALDSATRENGCLQVLKGTHRLGRLDHGTVGEQTGADPSRIHQIEDMFEHVYCEMSPGSVLFFHSNLLHASGPNDSDKHRRAFIICFNALANPQFVEQKTFEQRPCPVSADDAIERFAEALLDRA